MRGLSRVLTEKMGGFSTKSKSTVQISHSVRNSSKRTKRNRIPTNSYETHSSCYQAREKVEKHRGPKTNGRSAVCIHSLSTAACMYLHAEPNLLRTNKCRLETETNDRVVLAWAKCFYRVDVYPARNTTQDCKNFLVGWYSALAFHSRRISNPFLPNNSLLDSLLLQILRNFTKGIVN